MDSIEPSDSMTYLTTRAGWPVGVGVGVGALDRVGVGVAVGVAVSAVQRLKSSVPASLKGTEWPAARFARSEPSVTQGWVVSADRVLDMGDSKPMVVDSDAVLTTRFRRGQEPAKAEELIPGPGEHPAPSEPVRSGKSLRQEELDTTYGWEEREVVEAVIPKEQRHARQTETFTVGDRFLVFTGRGKRSDGTPFSHVEVRGVSGEVIDIVELPYQGYLNSPGDDCVIAYQDEIARIYSPDAILKAVFALKDLPEIRTVRDVHNQYFREQDLPFSRSLKDASPRLITASLSPRLLAVTILDHVFVYDFDGNVLLAKSLPRTTKREDWVYFLRFSREGKSLFIGGYSGLVVEIDLHGVVLETWRLGGDVPYKVVELEGLLSGTTREGAAFRLEHGGKVHFEGPGLVPIGDVIGRYMVSAERNKIAVFDLGSLSGFRVTLPQPRTAMYSENGQLAFETATKKYVLNS